MKSLKSRLACHRFDAETPTMIGAPIVNLAINDDGRNVKGVFVRPLRAAMITEKRAVPQSHNAPVFAVQFARHPRGAALPIKAVIVPRFGVVAVLVEHLQSQLRIGPEIEFDQLANGAIAGRIIEPMSDARRRFIDFGTGPRPQRERRGIGRRAADLDGAQIVKPTLLRLQTDGANEKQTDDCKQAATLARRKTVAHGESFSELRSKRNGSGVRLSAPECCAPDLPERALN